MPPKTRVIPTAGKILQDAMTKTGLTQAALSALSGVDVRYISAMVRGGKPITPETSVTLSVHLGIEPDVLAVAWTRQRVRMVVDRATRLVASMEHQS